MFASTIDLTDIHGTADQTLNRVRQDNYSSEYLLITDLQETRIFIRNTERLDKVRKVTIARHNVEILETVYPVGAVPSYVRKAFFTFEVQKGDVIASAVDVARELVQFLTGTSFDTLTKLANFES
jgi:hypothetical protein